jgi:chitin synthase
LDGIIAPTSEEAALYYHTPSIAAFNTDLEKGVDDPEGPINPARNLTKKELLRQRLFFGSLVLSGNVACIVASAMGYSGAWVLAIILFFKSKDFLSVWLQIVCRTYNKIKPLFCKAEKVTKSAWILSLIPAYSESEEQIVKTLFSLRDNGTGEHQQVMCVILDGKPRPIKSHMTRVVASITRKYVSLKWKIGTLQIDAGFVDDIPTICIEKMPNAGKKDSLVLCHDLFNHPRQNMDQSVKDLRDELWSTIIPKLTQRPNFSAFDLVFCTDADSTIHKGALAKLADACLEDPKAIAACGFVYVEYEPGLEWSVWNLYQQFQYSFGQIVRRGAEHFVGKVTCLPGCITMVVVRPEMAGAIQKYAEPVTTFPVLRHQVQYLGTDRRLTYSMLSQGKHLHTLFVPEAGSETVAPQSLKHYLSQRRRWGSNAYFNNYFYFSGANMILITRIAALVEISRLTMVYYRVFNTGLFLYGVATHFDALELLPLLIISFTPTFWFGFMVIFMNDHLRKNWKKLLCGFAINRCISPVMSVAVFSLVVRNLGSQVWGISGVTVGTNVTPAVAVAVLKEQAIASAEMDKADAAYGEAMLG